MALCCCFHVKVRLRGCTAAARRSRAPNVPQGESEADSAINRKIIGEMKMFVYNY